MHADEIDSSKPQVPVGQVETGVCGAIERKSGLGRR